MSTYITNIKVDFEYTIDTVLYKIKELINLGAPQYICTTNPEFVMAAQSDSDFKNIINNAALSLPDGIGMSYAEAYLKRVSSFKRDWLFPFRSLITGLMLPVEFRLGNIKLAERISGADLVYKMCELAESQGFTVFFLGGRSKSYISSDIASEAAKVLQQQFPKLKIIGATSKFSYKEEDDKDTILYIKECMNKNLADKVDMIFVGYGHAAQEKWINRNLSKVPATLGVGLGGTFNYISGDIRRSSVNTRKYHLEWLHRLIVEPRRLRRIVTAVLLFPLFVYVSVLKGPNYN